MDTQLAKTLNAKLLGTGTETLVLSHGFGGDQSMWKLVVPDLVKDYKVLVFDMAFSAAVDSSVFDFNWYTSLSAFAQDLVTLLQELNIQKCTFVGHSVSAMVGCLASVTRPDLFDKLILVSGSPRYLNDFLYEGGLESKEVDMILEQMKSDYAKWAENFAPMALGSFEPNEIVKEFTEKLMKMKPEIAVTAMRIILLSDCRGILGEVSMDCGIIQSRNDYVVPTKVGYFLKAHLGPDPNKNSVEILEISGHLPQLTVPTLFLRSLKSMLPPPPPSLPSQASDFKT